MQNVIETIRQNIALAHQQAVDCDKLIEELKSQGKGQFSAIFKEGFTTRSDKFLPYVEEMAAHFYDLIQLGQTEIPKDDLAKIVQQLEIIFSTQAKFFEALSDKTQMH